jgi:hypothetical protein
MYTASATVSKPPAEWLRPAATGRNRRRPRPRTPSIRKRRNSWHARSGVALHCDGCVAYHTKMAHSPTPVITSLAICTKSLLISCSPVDEVWNPFRSLRVTSEFTALIGAREPQCLLRHVLRIRPSARHVQFRQQRICTRESSIPGRGLDLSGYSPLLRHSKMA